jgi:protein ImuB
MVHLQRLTQEHLARLPLQAPAVALRLILLAHAPLPTASHDWTARPASENDRTATLDAPQLIERLSARLGTASVGLLLPQNDIRPECMQRTAPAMDAPTRPASARTPGGFSPEGGLLPTWLLKAPQPLAMRGHRPWFQGELQLLAGPWRLELTQWPDACEAHGQPHALHRDYFVALSPQAGRLWVFRVRPAGDAGAGSAWFLHGVYG